MWTFSFCFRSHLIQITMFALDFSLTAPHHCCWRRGSDQSSLGSFEHLYCLTVTLHQTQQTSQKVFWGCDQNLFDATTETIDGLNSFVFVFLNLITQDLFFCPDVTILQSNKCPTPAGGYPDLLGTKESSVWLPALWSPSSGSTRLSLLCTAAASSLSFYTHAPLRSPVSLHWTLAFT